MFVTQLLGARARSRGTVMHAKWRKPCKTAKNETIHARKSLLKIDAKLVVSIPSQPLEERRAVRRPVFLESEATLTARPGGESDATS
jgi:hypothetical protein